MPQLRPKDKVSSAFAQKLRRDRLPVASFVTLSGRGE
jgi:hypothetical protein